MSAVVSTGGHPCLGDAGGGSGNSVQILSNGSCRLPHSSSLPMIVQELSDTVSTRDGALTRQSALGSSRATSLDAACSDTSIQLPPSVSPNLPSCDSANLNRARCSTAKGSDRKISAHRKSSGSSTHSERRANLILQNVGRTIHRTHIHLRRTRLIHLFYLLALPLYTIAGALLFKTLDGEHDDSLRREYDRRCQLDRFARLAALERFCTGSTRECFKRMLQYLDEVEHCYRAWHEVNRTITHPMSDFTNALVYAFSVYTTIGYGNMAADTIGCRVATVIYGAFGIPLFFAFIKEEGNLFRLCFIWTYRYIRKMHLRKCPCFTAAKFGRTRNRRELRAEAEEKMLPNTVAILVERSQDLVARSHNVPFFHQFSTGSLLGSKRRHTAEQRGIFLAGVFVFILYLLAISGVFSIMTDWDYFTAFYFLFNSVALIGFGDVFPSEPRIILVNTVFIVMGVVLFSMCYFILQEEIREKAFEASRKARISISKYSHSLIQHTKNPWSRRNSPAFDSHGSPESSAFEKLRKRRQSAPVVSLTVPPLNPNGRHRS